ncbi:hypothetical protein Vafri_12662 [Volvox africanus]|uniref:Cytidyltransferase-like domain-containing protein n=1 Tax=Volvox africanus TaxID=51714 RepID=A0A8J4BAD1_9CHLO|nr:hypothetical protein Vafri_12662 [Volvox africanus]
MQKCFISRRGKYFATAATAAVATIASLWEYTATVSADGAVGPIAADATENKRGYDVWGAYLSPVADAYGKAGLAPAADRLEMCRLAAEDETANCRFGRSQVEDQHAHVSHTLTNPALNLTMVYEWEARQPGYTRTLTVLRRVESELRNWCSEGIQNSGAELTPGGCFSDDITKDQAGTSAQPLVPHSKPKPSLVRATLLCGGDVLASMAMPGVWRDPDVILREHGVVCIAREGTDLEQLINRPGSVLYDYRDHIVIVHDKVGNSISSSKVRQELATGRPVRYLVPPRVLSYIYERGLYGT